jgi:hypothetical protein
VQKLYNIAGALFFPFVVIALLLLNGRSAWVGAQFRNRPLTVIALLGVLAFFSALAMRTVTTVWGS